MQGYENCFFEMLWLSVSSVLQSSKMEPALSIIQVGKNDEREYLPEYKIFVAIYLYTHNPLNAPHPSPSRTHMQN